MLTELGYVWSDDGRCWHPKEMGSKAPIMTEEQAIALARHVLYRDDVRREERDTSR
ncbi:hypothetical protein PS395_08720 [Limosilactobacillus pontis]|uniref:hypothetical protein n=1 Tax=Limosilactobacillus pontis TaxID=35787 RepID=UPI002F26BA79